jgi:hypothetical protein
MSKSKIPSVDHPGPGVEVFLKPGETVVSQQRQSNYDQISYRSREVTVKNLTEVQRANLKRLVRELEDKEATLLNGSVVTDKSKAVRYLLENAYRKSDE